MTPALDAIVVQLEAQGWAAVGQVLTAEKAATIAGACERAIDALAGELRRGDDPGPGLRRLVDVAERVPEAGPVWQHRRLRAAAAHLLGRRPTLVRMTYRAAAPGHGHQTLHVDASTASAEERCDLVLAVVALSEFTVLNGATRVVPGSHTLPGMTPGSVPPGLRAMPDVPLVGPAGTGFVLRGNLVHRGAENRSGAVRPALLIGLGPKGRPREKAVPPTAP